MKLNEAVEYLTRCADANGNHWYEGRVWSDPQTCPTCHGTNDAGWLKCDGSRYGWTAAHCAPVAWRLDRLTQCGLDYAMGLVVNDSDAPEAEFREHAIGLSGANIESMVDGYLEAQLGLGLDIDRQDEDGNNPTFDENYDRDDIAVEYVDAVREELSGVVAEHPLAVRMYLAQRRYNRADGSVSAHFGHDFYLTREGHGTGFWDRGLGELGEYLTKIAKTYGEAAYLWDRDGKLTA